MGIYNKNIRNNNGISYSKEVDGPSDWINIESETYFKDLSDSLIYYKNSNDVVISIFEEGGVKTADNGLNISTGGDVELGGTLNKDTDINGNNKTLNLGTLTDTLNGININSITSTRTHTFPGFDSITSEYTPGNLTINSVSLSGDQTHQNTTTPLQYRREISDTSTNITSYINLQDQLTFSSENTSTSQSSILDFDTNQTSLSHSSGSGTSNVFTQADSETSLYYSGNTQNGITITGDTLNLYGPETNIDLNISGSIFTDNRVSGSTKGLEYGDDYHLGFTDRTLVDKAYVDNSIINNITGSVGAGLTYNTTTNKIDLGGVLDFNDPSNAANNIYFTPTLGTNLVTWGLNSDNDVATNSDQNQIHYITSFRNWSSIGTFNVTGYYGEGAYGNGVSGNALGCYEHQGNTFHIKEYKDVSQFSNSDGTINSFPGGDSKRTFRQYDDNNNHILQIWESDSTVGTPRNSIFTNTFSKFEWLIDNTAGHTSTFRFTEGGFNIYVPNADNSKSLTAILQPNGIYLKDGEGLGITTVPTGLLLGDMDAFKGLFIGKGVNDSYYDDNTTNKKGIKYSGFGETDGDTGVDADYTTLVNTSLVPKKYVDDVIVNNITGSAGAGLTFNTTTGKIDLGGVLDFNDSSNPSNNMYFIPSTGANIVRWGADSLGNLPVNSGGSAEYISRFDYVSFQGEHKIFGASGHLGVNIGVYESQISNNYLKQYKDVSQITIQSTPGINSSMTFAESDGPNYWSRTIWQSHDSNTKSVSNASYDKHTSEVYNANGHKSEVTLTETWFQSIVRNPDNSKTGQLMVGYYGIALLDGDSMGIQSFPNSILIGNSSTAEGLTIGMGSTDSKYTEGSTNKKGIKYSGFGETNEDTGVDADYTTLVNTSLVPKKYVDDIISNINGDNLSNANLTFDGSYYSDLNDNSWQLKDSTGANRILLDVQQGNANGHGIGYGGDAVDGKHTFYNTASSGTEALCNMSFLNGLKLSGGSLENDYLNFGSAGFSIKIKSNVSHGASIGVYPDVVLKAGHSSFGVILDTNNYVKFKKATVEHSLIDSSSRWILRGSAVIGDENISLQDDTLIKGSNNSVNTSGFKVTDINNDSLLDIRNNGQTCWGGAKVNNVAHIMYNPSGQASSLLRLIENSGNTGINLATDGRIETYQSSNAVFKTFAIGGVPHIQLYHQGRGNIIDLQSGASHIDATSLTLGGQTGKVGAKVSIMQASTNTSQQLFFGNITTNTAGRLGSSGSFGTDQKGLECFDTDLNKKLVWNGTTWEEISSGSSVDNSIYTVDDSLTDNRIVDLGGYNLTFQKLSSTTEYTKIYRNGGLEIRGSGFDVGDDVFKVKYKTNGNDLLSIGTNGGVTINSSISMGQFNATWNYGQQFSDGYISFFHGATWNDNEAIRFDLRNNTDASLTFNRNGQNTAGNRFIVRNSVLYETNYGTSKEQISLQGNTLIKGDSGLERTPYNFKIVNSSDDNTFVSNDDKSIEVYGRTKLLSKEHGILLNRVDSSEMFAISAEPDEIVHNTELNALYRWDNNLNTWVAMSAGYGIISINDSSGIPNYYATLSAAFTNASSGDVITLHSDITSTSQCIMPGATNATLNINGNGHTITHTSDTGSEFYLFYAGSGQNKILYLNDLKIVSNGTSTSTNSSIIAPNLGSSSVTVKSNSGTFISSVNNPGVFNSDIEGGNWTSTNSFVNFSGDTSDAKVIVKSGRGSFINCDITIVSGGQIGSLGDLIDCNITGDATVQNMIYSKVTQKIHGCTITCTSGAFSALGYAGGVTWTTTNPTPLKDTKVYYYGTHPYAVSAVYIASIKDVYIYSENTTALYTQNTTQTGGYNLENVVLETNATNRPAFYRLDNGTFRMKNVSATNWNSTNTEEAFDIRVSGTSELYMEGCSANVNNPLIKNVRLVNDSITTGGAYIYGLIMSKIGTGLNLNTVPLLNTNTADDYGNVKIG